MDFWFYCGFGENRLDWGDTGLLTPGYLPYPHFPGWLCNESCPQNPKHQARKPLKKQRTEKLKDPTSSTKWTSFPHASYLWPLKSNSQVSCWEAQTVAWAATCVKAKGSQLEIVTWAGRFPCFFLRKASWRWLVLLGFGWSCGCFYSKMFSIFRRDF